MNSTTARLRWLFVAQLGLSLVQLLADLMPPPLSIDLWPVTWALQGISLEPAMFLVFWCVFSGGSLRAKFSVLASAAVCFAVLNVAQHAIQKLVFQLPLVPQNDDEYLQSFLDGLASNAFFLAASYGCLTATRLYLGNPRLEISASPPKPKPTQFSLQDLFVITLLAAVYLGLARAYRYPWAGSLYVYRDWINSLLWVLFSSTSIMLASWAALGSGYVRQRVCLALFAAVVVWLAHHVATADGPMTIRDWLIFTLLLIELPTAILVGSLRVVRSCGYRLVPTAV